MSNASFLFFLGCVAFICGILALANPFAASISIEIFVGWMFLIIGAFSLVAVFRMRGARLWALVMAGMTFLVGICMIANPIAGLVALTFVVAIVLLFSGAARLMMAGAMRDHPSYWFLLLSGILSFVLGVMIFTNVPRAAESILGIFLGIELVSVAVSLFALGAGARKFGL